MKVHRCTTCGRLTHPAHYVCRQCRGKEFQEVDISDGTLVTHTTISVPPSGLMSPLRLGIVEFEGGVRALGQLLEEMDIGTKVRAEWTVVRKGDRGDQMGFAFRKR